MLKKHIENGIKISVYIPLIIILFIGCKDKNKMIKQLEGKWYGQRQALGDTFSIAASKILADENSGRIKNEYANLTFRDGILFLAFKDNDQKIVDSAKYSLSEDSILTSGHYKTKVIKLTNDSLLLYSKDEKILKSLRIFTRQK